MTFYSALRRLLMPVAESNDHSLDSTFRRVVEQSADVICQVIDGRFRYVSPSARDMFGWDPEALIGTNGLSVIYEPDRLIVQEAMGRWAPGQINRNVNQLRVICGDGSLRWMETTAQTEAAGSHSDVTLVMRDITVRKQLEEELTALALQDGLTGLANRRAFDQALERAWRQTMRTSGEMALVLLDIDCFKQFNDLYGHQAGDDCLRSVSDCIRKNARRPTDLACRYGGEEIVVILSSTGLEAAVAIAAAMRSGVADLGIPHQGSACADRVTVSIGVAATIARTGGTMQMPEGLLQAADHALYKAKAAGRNCVEQAMIIALADS